MVNNIIRTFHLLIITFLLSGCGYKTELIYETKIEEFKHVC